LPSSLKAFFLLSDKLVLLTLEFVYLLLVLGFLLLTELGKLFLHVGSGRC